MTGKNRLSLPLSYQSPAYFAALHIVQVISSQNDVAYFVGGWVRDYLLKKHCDDIDIATSASPSVIQSLFPHTKAVGKAFGVILVHHRGFHIEVATFRTDEGIKNGRHPQTVSWSMNAKEDAQRRDFTVNGLFYDPLKNEVIDYVDGKRDVEKKILRTIGSPEKRFQEDRLRMIRAIRFASTLGFTLCPTTHDAIVQQATTLMPAVSIERIWQEWNKMQKKQALASGLSLMHKTGLLSVIFPLLNSLSCREVQRRIIRLTACSFSMPTILFIAALFPPLCQKAWMEFARQYRISKEDREWTFFYSMVLNLELSDHNGDAETAYRWIQLYADEKWECCLQLCLMVYYGEEKRKKRLQYHREQRLHFANQIARLRNRTPVVTANDLKKRGVIPGKRMGQLLKEAEKIAVVKQLEKPDQVISILFSSLKKREG